MIELGDRIVLDTKGPSISRLEILPGSPVKNSEAAPVEMQVSFGLTEEIKPDLTPQIQLNIANGRQMVDLTNITKKPQ